MSHIKSEDSNFRILFWSVFIFNVRDERNYNAHKKVIVLMILRAELYHIFEREKAVYIYLIYAVHQTKILKCYSWRKGRLQNLIVFHRCFKCHRNTKYEGYKKDTIVLSWCLGHINQSSTDYAVNLFTQYIEAGTTRTFSEIDLHGNHVVNAGYTRRYDNLRMLSQNIQSFVLSVCYAIVDNFLLERLNMKLNMNLI